jgi:hypothetical protein
MADVSKLKTLKGRRSNLGDPPSLDEASNNLNAPEIAPAPSLSPKALGGKIDGRTARRTNRTVQFATRVTPDWDARIRTIADREGIKLVEVLERALDYYELKSSR